MFKKNLNATLEALGLSDKANNNTLTKSDWKKIAAKYKEMHGSDMYEDIAAEQEHDSEREEQHQQALAILASADDSQTEDKGEHQGNIAEQATRVATQNKALKDENQNLKTENEELKSKMKSTILPDHPEVVETVVSLNGLGHTENYAFGIPHDMFSTKKRWNQVTVNPKFAKLSSPTDADEKAFQAELSQFGQSICNRMDELFESGKLQLNAENKLDVDYSGLTNAGLGNQYVIRRTDEIIARILKLKSVDHLYPIQWGIQDRDVVTNAFFGEFSQGYQEGEVMKGEMSLQPELGHVDDAMYKTKFNSYKWIERTYLAYKNTSGSAAVKWSMIEWTVLEIVKVLYNEQYVRNIRGMYVKPIKNVPGSYLNAGTGLIYTLVRYYHENKLLPLDDELYRDYDETGTIMVDVVKAFIAEIKAKEIDIDTLGLSLDLNLTHQDWWKEACRRKYGKDIDFTGPNSYVNVVPDTTIPIRWVPNMGNIKMMILQKPGNLQRLGFVPGEMTAIRFQEFMESVLSWSVWKEGFSAAFVGKPFNSLEELKANDYQDQHIFINKPCIELAADVSEIDGKAGFWFLTGKNTAPGEDAEVVNITDIKNAQKGVVYIIECGTVENAPTIKKAGAFDTISADWIPAKTGDYIMVIKRQVSESDSQMKIQEVERCVNGVRTINKVLQPNIPGAR